MTRRQAILEVILSRLGAITTANGYATDGGDAIVFAQNVELGESDPDEAIGVAISDDLVSDQGGYGAAAAGPVSVTLPVHITSLAKLTADPAEGWRRSEALLGDIKRAIESGDRTLGGQLDKPIMRTPARTRPRDGGSTTVAAGVGYVLTYSETFGDPEA